MATETKITLDQLESAFRTAVTIGMEALPGSDGGTCNFDSATFQLPGFVPDIVIETAKNCGLYAYYREKRRGDMWGDTYFVDLNVATGQGERRTRVALAINRALKAHGLDTCMYYQMD